DENREAALAAEREKKRKAIAELEMQFMPKLAELPPEIPGDKYLAYLPSQKVQSPLSAAFSPNGKLLAISGAGRHTDIWDLESAKRLRTVKGDGWGRVLFSPDSRSLATVGVCGSKFQVWEVGTGNLKIEREHGFMGLCDVFFSADGK